MRRTDALRALAFAVAASLPACAGSVSQFPEPPPDAQAADAARSLQDLLSRLDILIATRDEDDSLAPALLAEARALRSEALAALAAGDEALARDFLEAAIVLFGDTPR
jgi:hypothetical protein